MAGSRSGVRSDREIRPDGPGAGTRYTRAHAGGALTGKGRGEAGAGAMAREVGRISRVRSVATWVPLGYCVVALAPTLTGYRTEDPIKVWDSEHVIQKF